MSSTWEILVTIHKACGFRVRSSGQLQVVSDLYIQGHIDGIRKDTEGSVWNDSGKSAGEDHWTKGELRWEMENKQLQHVKSYSPRFKLYVYTNEKGVIKSLGWCVLDLR